MMEEDFKLPHLCYVCGKHKITYPFEECPICGWMDDCYNHTYKDAISPSNEMSLNEARAAYKRGEEVK